MTSIPLSSKCGTFLDGLLGVVLLVVAQPPQPAPFLGVVLQVGAQRPQPASFRSCVSGCGITATSSVLLPSMAVELQTAYFLPL